MATGCTRSPGHRSCRRSSAWWPPLSGFACSRPTWQQGGRDRRSIRWSRWSWTDSASGLPASDGFCSRRATRSWSHSSAIPSGCRYSAAPRRWRRLPPSWSGWCRTPVLLASRNCTAKSKRVLACGTLFPCFNRCIYCSPAPPRALCSPSIRASWRGGSALLCSAASRWTRCWRAASLSTHWRTAWLRLPRRLATGCT